MNILIIGANAAGLSCLDTLCTISPHANIIVISAEKYSPYRRCLLPDYIGNAVNEQELTISSPSDYPSNVHFIRGQKAEQINLQKKTVRLSDGEDLEYDKLCIAVGAEAVKPKYYAEGKRTFTLRYLDDAKKIALRGDVPVGMAFYNCPKEAGLFVTLIKKAMPLTVNPQKIVNGAVSISDIMKTDPIPPSRT